jgi:hypothetical protein
MRRIADINSEIGGTRSVIRGPYKQTGWRCQIQGVTRSGRRSTNVWEGALNNSLQTQPSHLSDVSKLMAFKG